MATLKSIKNKYLSASDGTILGVTTNTENISALSFKLATADSLSKFNLVDGFADDYNDATGVDVATSTNEVRDSANYYSGVLINNGPAIDGYVETLFHGDGANSGTTFTDSSSNGFTVQSSGNIVTSTASPKFGTASIHVPNTTNDYIYWGAGSASLHLDAAPFTISFWIKTTHSSGGGTIFGRNNGSAGQHNFDVALQITSSGLMDMVINTNTEYASAAPTTTAVNDGEWHHIEFVRNGANVYSFTDGTLEGTTNVTTTTVINRESSAFYIGYMNGGHYTGAICYIDEFEFSPGIARHTATFTPPSAPWGGTDENYNNMTLVSNAFTAQADPTTARIILDEETVAGTTTLNTDLKAYASRDNGTTFTQITNLASQANITYNAGIDSYTKLMMHCDGDNSGTAFTDSSLTPHIITSTNTITSTTTPKFGTASAYFDGSGDYMSIPYSTDFDFGTDDITIDFWFRTPQVPNSGSAVPGNNTPIWGYCEYTAGRWHGWGFGGREKTTGVVTMMSLGMISDLTGAYAEPDDEITIPIDNSWHHYAYVRQGTVAKIYKDGVLGSTYTGTAGNINASDLDTTSTLRFGIFEFTDVYWGELKGNLDEIRISKGIARWTAPFTPPAAPYTNERRLLSGSVDISGQPSGTSVKYKIETLNQAVGKQTRVYGTSMAWA